MQKGAPTDANKAAARLLRGGRRRALSDYVTSKFPDSFVFPFNPDPLSTGNNYDIYDEMRRDDQVKSVLAIKKEIAISTGWQIQTENQEIKEDLEKELNNLHAFDAGLDLSFEDVMRDMLSCVDYGFSLTEPVFKVRPDGKWGIRSLKTRPPHSFEFELDDKGTVLAVRQDLKKFRPDQFIHVTYQSDFGNPYGESDLRAAHDPWKAKKFMDRFFAIYMERYAAPFTIAKYKDGMDENEIEELHKIVKNVQISTGMTLPEDVMIEIIETSKDASQAFERALDHYSMRIARAILVPDLLGISGAKTGGGSFALGEKHFSLFLGLINALRKNLERKINLKLIFPLVAVNYGEQAAKDVAFKFLPYSEELLLDNFKIWSDAINGLKIKPSDEQINHLNRSLGFPEAEEVERVEEPQNDPLDPKNPAKDAEQGKGNKKPAERNSEPSKDKEMAASFSADRELTSFERKMDFAKIEKVLNRSEKDLLPGLTMLNAKAMRDLSDRMVKPLAKKDAKKVISLETRFLRDINAAWRDHFTDLFKEGTSEAQKEILPRGTFDAEPLMQEEYLEIIRAEAFKVVKDWNEFVSKKAKNTVIQGMKQGLSSSELFTIVRKQMADESDTWVRNVISTKTTEVYNQARKLYFENDPIAKQIVVAYQWSAILDSRTSRICRTLDRKIWKIGEYTDRVTPPAHHGCRSVVVPITKFEQFTESKKLSPATLKDLGGNLIMESEVQE